MLNPRRISKSVQQARNTIDHQICRRRLSPREDALPRQTLLPIDYCRRISQATRHQQHRRSLWFTRNEQRCSGNGARGCNVEAHARFSNHLVLSDSRSTGLEVSRAALVTSRGLLRLLCPGAVGLSKLLGGGWRVMEEVRGGKFAVWTRRNSLPFDEATAVSYTHLTLPTKA